MRNTVAKKRAAREDVDSDCLFGNSLERPAFRYNPCLPPAGRSLLWVLPAELPHYNPSRAVIIQRLICPILLDQGTRSSTLSLVR